MAKELINLLILIFTGALASVERFAFFQLSLSRPFVISVILGYLLNQLAPFFYIGIFFEILWLYKLPIGSVTPPHDTVGVFAALITFYIGTILHGEYYVILSWAIVVGIFSGLLGKRGDSLLRVLMTNFVTKTEKNIESGELKLFRNLILALTLNFSVHFISLFFITIVSLVFTYIIINIEFAFRPSYIFATSLSTVLIGRISIIYNKEKFKVFTIYFLLTFFSFMIYNFFRWNLI